MNKRDILIVAIVAVVASLSVSAFAPQVGLGPGGIGPTPTSQFAATSCDRDVTCEMNGAKIQGPLETGPIQIIGALRGDVAFMNDIYAKWGITTFKLSTQMLHTQMLAIGEVFMINDEGNGYLAGQMEFGKVDTEELEVEGPAGFFELSGKGTAFVCTNNMGRIYSSQEPCS